MYAASVFRKQGISQAQVAELVGASQGQVSRLLGGKISRASRPIRPLTSCTLSGGSRAALQPLIALNERFPIRRTGAPDPEPPFTFSAFQQLLPKLSSRSTARLAYSPAAPRLYTIFEQLLRIGLGSLISLAFAQPPQDCCKQEVGHKWLRNEIVHPCRQATFAILGKCGCCQRQDW